MNAFYVEMKAELDRLEAHIRASAARRGIVLEKPSAEQLRYWGEDFMRRKARAAARGETA